MLPIIEKILAKAREIPVSYQEPVLRPPVIDTASREILNKRLRNLEVKVHLLRHESLPEREE